MLHLFPHLLKRKRVVLNNEHYVHGDIFGPGAYAYALVPTAGSPVFVSDVDKARNFQTLPVTQPPLDWQDYVVPNGATTGEPYSTLTPDALLALQVAYGDNKIPDNVYG
jgi:hypothetical protein